MNPTEQELKTALETIDWDLSIEKGCDGCYAEYSGSFEFRGANIYFKAFGEDYELELDETYCKDKEAIEVVLEYLTKQLREKLEKDAELPLDAANYDRADREYCRSVGVLAYHGLSESDFK